MYANAKLCVKLGHLKSTRFSRHVDVCQGENLSPLLTYLTEFISYAYDGLTYVNNMAKIL